jgi:hypothetical protein
MCFAGVIALISYLGPIDEVLDSARMEVVCFIDAHEILSEG